MPYIPKRYTQITGVFKIWAAPPDGNHKQKKNGQRSFFTKRIQPVFFHSIFYAFC